MATSRRSSLAKMRLCIFASIFELLPLVQSSDSALLLKVRITSKCKQLAYIRQGSTAESLPGLFLLRRFRLAACVAFCRDGRDRGRRRAHKGPANAGGVPRILPNHDLGGAAGDRRPRPGTPVLPLAPFFSPPTGSDRPRPPP